MKTKRDTAPARKHRGGKVLHFIQASFYRLPFVLQYAGMVTGTLAMAGAVILFFCLVLGVPGGGQ